jgi:hypothetical protein
MHISAQWTAWQWTARDGQLGAMDGLAMDGLAMEGNSLAISAGRLGNVAMEDSAMSRWTALDG